MWACLGVLTLTLHSIAVLQGALCSLTNASLWPVPHSHTCVANTKSKLSHMKYLSLLSSVCNCRTLFNGILNIFTRWQLINSIEIVADVELS